MAEFSSQQTKNFNDRPSDVLDIKICIVNFILSFLKYYRNPYSFKISNKSV